MTEEKSLVELMREEAEKKEEYKSTRSIILKEPALKEPTLKVTNVWLESLVKELEDEDYHKITVIKEILLYTTTEKALHTCGEILKGKSLKRTNKKTLAIEVKNLIDEKILKIDNSIEGVAKEISDKFTVKQLKVKFTAKQLKEKFIVETIEGEK